jgi:hypothetical protein
MVNPLDPVMDWYEIAFDSLRVTQRVVDQKIPRALTKRHKSLYGKPAEGCLSLLDSAKDELDRLVVLALTAIFERTLRDHLIQIPLTALPLGDPQRDAVRQEIVKDIEFWNISSRVLDVFPAVDRVTVGLVKQVIDYRNWVAHGHSLARPAPSNVIPGKAYQDLTTFLVQAGILGP